MIFAGVLRVNIEYVVSNQILDNDMIMQNTSMMYGTCAIKYAMSSPKLSKRSQNLLSAVLIGTLGFKLCSLAGRVKSSKDTVTVYVNDEPRTKTCSI